MAPTNLQRRVVKHLAINRSQVSYLAGGIVLNKDWPRQSDDIDIFQDTDEEIWGAAHRDLDVLRHVGFSIRIDVDVYGIVEAVVGEYGEETQIQWMSESRRRFLPLIHDEEWGFRLAPADLAVNKVLAASTRRKARDVVDIASIGEHLCPIGPLAMAASGKPPHFSPLRILDEIRRNCQSIWRDDYLSVKGLPETWTPEFIRDRVLDLLDQAATYIQAAPDEVVGRLAIDQAGTPVEVSPSTLANCQLRAPSEEQEVVPQFKDGIGAWAVPGR